MRALLKDLCNIGRPETTSEAETSRNSRRQKLRFPYSGNQLERQIECRHEHRDGLIRHETYNLLQKMIYFNCLLTSKNLLICNPNCI